MPIIKSAIKRVRQTERRTARNVIRKRFLKVTLKNFITLIEEKKFEEAAKLLPAVQKNIDLTVKNNLWHAHKGARIKSQYAKMLPKTTAKAAAPKAEAKPAAEKSVSAKATTDKKAPAKKPATKKAE
jgi:ribosomal protein S20